MVRYSELSKAQKAVIDGMRLGQELQWDRVGHVFTLNDKERGFRISVKDITAKSLLQRNFILEFGNSFIYIVYKLNPDID